MYHKASEKANVGKYHAGEDAIMVAEAKAILREYYKRPNLELYRLLKETGFLDFEPFDPELQNTVLVNCSDPGVIASGTCGTTLFTNKNKYLALAIGMRLIFVMSRKDQAIEILKPSIDVQVVKSSDQNSRPEVEGVEALKDGQASKTALENASVHSTDSETEEKDKDLRDQLTQSSKTETETGTSSEKGGQGNIKTDASSLDISQERPSTMSNSSIEDVTMDSIPDVTYSSLSAIGRKHVPLSTRQNLNVGPTERFKMSSSDRFFRSLSAVVLVVLLFYIFRKFGRNRSNQRTAGRDQ